MIYIGFTTHVFASLRPDRLRSDCGEAYEAERSKPLPWVRPAWLCRLIYDLTQRDRKHNRRQPRWSVCRMRHSMTTWRRKNRESRDLHLLDENGMVGCNPRDREAAH